MVMTEVLIVLSICASFILLVGGSLTLLGILSKDHTSNGKWGRQKKEEN